MISVAREAETLQDTEKSREGLFFHSRVCGVSRICWRAAQRLHVQTLDRQIPVCFPKLPCRRSFPHPKPMNLLSVVQLLSMRPPTCAVTGASVGTSSRASPCAREPLAPLLMSLSWAPGPSCPRWLLAKFVSSDLRWAGLFFFDLLTLLSFCLRPCSTQAVNPNNSLPSSIQLT